MAEPQTKDKANWGKPDDPLQLKVVELYVAREVALRQKFGPNHTKVDRTQLWQEVTAG